MLDQVDAVPAELGAFILLELVSGDHLPCPDQKLLTLQRAFELAGRAQAQTPLIYTGPRQPMTRQFLRGAASATGLDRDSLQARVVTAMIPLKPDMAGEHFLRMEVPSNSKVTCADRLVQDPQRYYMAASAILLHSGWKADELRASVEVVFRGVRNSAGLARALENFSAGHLPRPLLERVWPVIVDRLTQINDSDRVFTQFAPKVDAALQKYWLPDLTAANANIAPLLAVYRGYVKRHLSGRRCADNAASVPWWQDSPLLKEGLTREEQTPRESISVEPLKPLFPDEGKLMQATLSLLTKTDEGKVVPRSDDPAAKEAVNMLLRESATKGADREDPTELSFKGLTVLSALGAVAPASVREYVTQRFFAELATSPLQSESFIEWWFCLEDYLGTLQELDSREYERVAATSTYEANAAVLLVFRALRLKRTGRP